ncbi:MAG: hypothetical protein KDA45_07115 [Planctomycetales bacterium]|nr:hypothetical protein [Planctomycetales bacterium]
MFGQAVHYRSLTLPGPWFMGWPLFVIGCLTASGGVQAWEDAEERTVRAMCRMGLSASAIEYVSARRRLVAEDPSAQAKWTMRLMECHAFAAWHSRSAAQPQWEQCQAVYDEFVSRDPDNARLPWLAWQQARCDLLQAQAAVAQYLAAPANALPREKALELVRRILTAVEGLEEDIRQRQPLAARQGIAGGQQAPAEQLRQLAVDAVLLRCEALLIRGQLYPSGSTDRIAAASDVEQQANDVLQRTTAEWESREPLQVAQAAARLELGQAAAAVQQLAALARNGQQREVRIRAATLAIAYLAAQGEVSRAQALLAILEQADAGPERLLAQMELSLAEAAATSGAAKQRLLSNLIEQAKHLGQRYGDYWRSRGEALLINSLPRDALPHDANLASELLIVEVRQLLAAGDELAAIQKLLNFSDHEAAQGRNAAALKLGSQAAALHQRREQWLAAADILEPLSLRFPDEQEAALLHQQAIVCVSQALRSQVTDAGLRQRYESLLQQQLTHWPDAVASYEAREWLASWLGGQNRHQELLAVLLAQASACDAASAALDVLLHWADVLLNLEQPVQQQTQLAAFAAALAEGQLQPVQNSAAILHLFVESLLRWSDPSASDKALTALARWQATSSPPTLQQMAVAIRVLHALRDESSWDKLPRLLESWEPLQLSLPAREGLAKACIEAIDEAPPAEHAARAQQLKLDQSWAAMLLDRPSPASQAAGYRLLAWLGQPSEALSGLDKLAQASSRQGGVVQLQLAHALADSGPQRVPDSSRIAKLLVANSPPGSQLNLAARWRLLKNQLLLGETEEARQAARLLLATQPLDSTLWQARFERLANDTSATPVGKPGRLKQSLPTP